ncbi:MAG: aminopeptidase [Gaiellaceae bacterium]
MPDGTDILPAAARARYADAIVESGVALRHGDMLVVSGQPRHRELLIAISEAGYRRGARHVEIETDDPLVAAARFRHGGRQALGARAPWIVARARTLMRDDAAIVHVAGDGEPGSFDGIPPQKLAADQAAVRKNLRFFVNATQDGRVRWSIAAWPTAAWATQVYPDLSRLAAQRRLAGELLRFCRLGDADLDGTAGWIEHAKTLEARAKTLTRLRLQRLKLSGPGTELELGIAAGARWLGGRERTQSGRLTSPNMPTEEVFTSPDPRGTSGTFRCSRPLNFRGRTIKGIGGEFEKGRLVRLEADEADDLRLLTAFLDTDANARRLGEVALLDKTSRIGSTGRTYFNTLLDENAAAHIAFGAGFPNTREKGAAAVNRSQLHLDVMVGTAELGATGFGARGKRVPLIAGGEWQI